MTRTRLFLYCVSSAGLVPTQISGSPSFTAGVAQRASSVQRKSRGSRQSPSNILTLILGTEDNLHRKILCFRPDVNPRC